MSRRGHATPKINSHLLDEDTEESPIDEALKLANLYTTGFHPYDSTIVPGLFFVLSQTLFKPPQGYSITPQFTQILSDLCDFCANNAIYRFECLVTTAYITLLNQRLSQSRKVTEIVNILHTATYLFNIKSQSAKQYALLYKFIVKQLQLHHDFMYYAQSDVCRFNEVRMMSEAIPGDPELVQKFLLQEVTSLYTHSEDTNIMSSYSSSLFATPFLSLTPAVQRGNNNENNNVNDAVPPTPMMGGSSHCTQPLSTISLNAHHGVEKIDEMDQFHEDGISLTSHTLDAFVRSDEFLTQFRHYNLVKEQILDAEEESESPERSTKMRYDHYYECLSYDIFLDHIERKRQDIANQKSQLQKELTELQSSSFMQNIFIGVTALSASAVFMIQRQYQHFFQPTITPQQPLYPSTASLNQYD